MEQLSKRSLQFIQLDEYCTNLSSCNIGNIVALFCNEINNNKYYVVTNVENKMVEFSEIGGSGRFEVRYEK